MNYCELPPEFSGLAGRVNYVHRVNDNEYHSSCPNCGGDMHPDGSPPNRFIMWVASRSGTPFGMCVRGCQWRWSPTKEDANWTPEERAEMEAKRKEFEAAREAKIKRTAKTIDEHLIVGQTHYEAMNDPEAMEYFTVTRKIPYWWFDYFKLGLYRDYPITNHLGGRYKSNAYTIPVWSFGQAAGSPDCENLKLRISNPQSDNDRYRNLYKSGAQHLFITDFDAPNVGNTAVAIEGEFKAITARIYGALPNTHTITGWQSKSPEDRILRQYSGSEVIYLCLDWDAYVPDRFGNVTANRIAKRLGAARVRYVIPPSTIKFDDAMLEGYNFRNAVNMAIKPQNWKYWSDK